MVFAAAPKAPTGGTPSPMGTPRGDDRRLREAVASHFDVVWRTLRRMGLEAADAEDVTQEAFLVLSRRLAEVFPGRERAYLFASALRIAATRRRGRERERRRIEGAPLPCGEPLPDPDTALQERGARELLDQTLANLEPPLRSVFVLFELEDMTLAEIAEMLQIPAGTAASRLRRARELFQADLKRLRARAETGKRP